VTDRAGLGLAGFAADCPLVLAADATTGAVGLAHASWRGTVGRIASRLIERLAEAFGGAPGDVTACICPSAGPCCYEVGDDVVRAAHAGIGPHAGAFFRQRGGRTYFDLWAANADQLRRAGVPSGQIHIAGVCTICHRDVFCSYRAEGPAAGRFLAVIARKGE